MKRVQILENPAGDRCWSALLERHAAASIFHSPGWLRALQETYGYQPFVLTTSSGPRLDNGIVICRVKGWASRRLVSLPFSDHCDPLVDGAEELHELLAHLVDETRTRRWRSAELRPTEKQPFEQANAGGLQPSREYLWHRLDLRPDASEIFRRFHPSHMRRAVRRAEREGITCETGTSDEQLRTFYRLLRMTRRRHGLPPQPIAWFRNLVKYLGDQAAIHVARKNGQPIASLLTLSFKESIAYKYGGSDASLHHLGGVPFLFWRVIQDARARGFTELDLGRSDIDQPGLIAFKDHLGATRSLLTYYCYPERPDDLTRIGWLPRVARGVFTHLPDSALDLAGRLLYKRLG